MTFAPPPYIRPWKGSLYAKQPIIGLFDVIRQELDKNPNLHLVHKGTVHEFLKTLQYIPQRQRILNISI